MSNESSYEGKTKPERETDKHLIGRGYVRCENDWGLTSQSQRILDIRMRGRGTRGRQNHNTRTPDTSTDIQMCP